MKFRTEGEDLFIAETAILKRPHLIDIGKHVAIDYGVYISTEAIIGDYAHIAPYVCVIGGEKSKLVMGNFCGISAGSKIVCGSDDYTKGLTNPQVPEEFKNTKYTTVTFEDFTCVGVNCVIMPNVTLGIGSVVGAGSVVTRDTEPWGIYVGTPAKKIGERDREAILENSKKMGY